MTKKSRMTPYEMRRRFHEQGLKVTPQRVAIYQALIETSSHPTADALYTQVKRVHPMLSQNTVYYTLGIFQQAGLVQEVNYWHDRSQFDANMSPHHHLICLGCRTIHDLTDGALDRISVPTQALGGFKVTGHQVEFYGYCSRCRRRKQTGTRTRKE